MQRSLCRLLRSQWESVPIQLGRHVVLATWQSFGTCKVFVECTVAWFRVPSISKMLLPPCLWLCGGPLNRWSSTQGRRFISMLLPNIFQKPLSFYNLRWMHGIDAVRKLMTSINWTKLCGIWDAEMHIALNDTVFQAPVCILKNHTSVFPAKLDRTPFEFNNFWMVCSKPGGRACL